MWGQREWKSGHLYAQPKDPTVLPRFMCAGVCSGSGLWSPLQPDETDESLQLPPEAKLPLHCHQRRLLSTNDHSHKISRWVCSCFLLPFQSSTGTGCLVKAVSYGAGREPIVIGKPHPPIMNVIEERYVYMCVSVPLPFQILSAVRSWTGLGPSW